MYKNYKITLSGTRCSGNIINDITRQGANIITTEDDANTIYIYGINKKNLNSIDGILKVKEIFNL
jgi:hypothetical protein